MSISKDLVAPIGVMLVGFLIAGTASSPDRAVVDPVPEQRTSDVTQRSDAASGEAADTLHVEGAAGEVLIFDLPEYLDGRAVESYALIHSPALSWLVDYSFMWRTLPQDTGRHIVRISAAPAADTLLVSILLE